MFLQRCSYRYVQDAILNTGLSYLAKRYRVGWYVRVEMHVQCIIHTVRIGAHTNQQVIWVKFSSILSHLKKIIYFNMCSRYWRAVVIAYVVCTCIYVHVHVYKYTIHVYVCIHVHICTTCMYSVHVYMYSAVTPVLPVKSVNWALSFFQTLSASWLFPLHSSAMWRLHVCSKGVYNITIHAHTYVHNYSPHHNILLHTCIYIHDSLDKQWS